MSQPRTGTRVFSTVIRRLERRYATTVFVEHHGTDPYRILIGCVLSLRTRDEVSFPATSRLFERASTPQAMLRLRPATIEKLIYPAGFYRRKTDQIRRISRMLLDRHDGQVPDEIGALLELPGVGRKTANLVVTLGFAKPGICVDTHVHRISNRLGWVRTRTPDQTEQVLRQVLPQRHWIVLNELLVHHGQQICKPISPICTDCDIFRYCKRDGVDRSR